MSDERIETVRKVLAEYVRDSGLNPASVAEAALDSIEAELAKVERLQTYVKDAYAQVAKEHAKVERHSEQRIETARLREQVERLTEELASVRAAHGANVKMHGEATAYYRKMREAETKVERYEAALREAHDAVAEMRGFLMQVGPHPLDLMDRLDYAQLRLAALAADTPPGGRCLRCGSNERGLRLWACQDPEPADPWHTQPTESDRDD